MSAYEVSVPIRRPILALLPSLLLVPWLGFVRFAALLLRGIVRPESSTEFVFCLLLGIPFIGIAAGFGLGILWLTALNLCGTDTLQVTAGKLRMRQGVLGLGRWKEFRAEEISNLRTGGIEWEGETRQKAEEMTIQDLVRTGRMFAWARGAFRFFGISPTLVFRAKGRTHWFGSSPGESRAREILARLRMHLPESAFVPTQSRLTLFGELGE